RDLRLRDLQDPAIGQPVVLVDLAARDLDRLVRQGARPNPDGARVVPQANIPSRRAAALLELTDPLHGRPRLGACPAETWPADHARADLGREREYVPHAERERRVARRRIHRVADPAPRPLPADQRPADERWNRRTRHQALTSPAPARATTVPDRVPASCPSPSAATAP